MKKKIGLVAILVVSLAFVANGAFAKQKENVADQIKNQVEKFKQSKKTMSLKDQKIKIVKDQKIDLKELKKLREVK